MGGPQSWSEIFGENEHLLPRSGFEPRTAQPKQWCAIFLNRGPLTYEPATCHKAFLKQPTAYAETRPMEPMFSLSREPTFGATNTLMEKAKGPKTYMSEENTHTHPAQLL